MSRNAERCMKLMAIAKSQRPFVTGGLLMGVGLGGFFDGILFHQILQLHAMLTGKIAKLTVPDVEINMFWDGMFHAVTWTATVVGLSLLWRAIRKMETRQLSTRVLVGSLFMGWGAFNFIEGLIDHHILHLHHVVESLGLSVFDYLFLASGVVFYYFGRRAVLRGQREIGAESASYPRAA